ncbi:MAG: preprotein translocase subunit SecA [Halothiobacillus sp. 24-54-40]|jgi:preprotein translocase subunit SecA|nr:MAG: preprotein translocase subunit SecA [Halothiobacillus sp. 35-54-62]OYY56817.1 MAG: preprotein translocase subunit SecA [Halothiobacillus sp. 28-55-5]OYZ88384.1 MAG: preprotein translocase subunit SecA [Halothiobacillus sp. 24-54-40]OZA81692.1 MAG: preprotein translocase subunit SecA [Halothiobacillus sp. 39-53-45]HQS01816.1 preprotein translocase subunit SecA [Halothiobacillus sp.]
MIASFVRKIFGTRNDRIIKQMGRSVAQINALEAAMQALDDVALRAKTDEFHQRWQKGETLDQLLPEAFAVCREMSQRVLGMRHFDVQLIGGMALHMGKISEMRTGEGKTLVATLAVYLNALTRQGVHVVTVNDYLARRDAEWMGRLYNALGLSIGIVVPNMDTRAKFDAYRCDVTYATNNELGFDYLRDNMAFNQDNVMQRELVYAIVDEVDSILIDEARTPLIISGPAADSSEAYQKINGLMPELKKQAREEPKDDEPPLTDEERGDFTVDEKNKQVFLTEQGFERAESLLIQIGLLQEGESLYDAHNIMLLSHLNAALRAHSIYRRNVEYIVRDNEVIIVDEFTGRTLAGRRWSEGLHQAVEAKEGLPIQPENQTLASITFQNFFRLYTKLSGMTGTADTEAREFAEIYNLEVVQIPTNRAVQRSDLGDLVFLTPAEKYEAIVKDVLAARGRNQPTLVGTASIETSEIVSNALTQAKIPHNVLNAKQHEREAEIIAEAGRPGAVTIATNMAGRGTDIMLGGNLEQEQLALGSDATESAKAEVKAAWQQRHDAAITAGGLHVIGTERHESRRVDNQLRGRSGRQGDPGSTRFFLSLEDNLMRVFASDRVGGLMKKLGMQQGEAIEHPWVTRAIENAQRKVEGHNFDQRKHLLDYDNVANEQRKVIYDQRRAVMATTDTAAIIVPMRREVMAELFSKYIPAEALEEQWDIAGLTQVLAEDFGQEMPLADWLASDKDLHAETLFEKILATLEEDYSVKEAIVGADSLRQFEKGILLQVLDSHWKEHLAAMDYLRQSIGLRGYAQKNPTQEYKREAFEMFSRMLDELNLNVVKVLSRLTIAPNPVTGETVLDDLLDEVVEAQYFDESQLQLRHDSVEEFAEEPRTGADTAPVRVEPKLGRNDLCWCGSGKKYKHCHGKLV